MELIKIHIFSIWQLRCKHCYSFANRQKWCHQAVNVNKSAAFKQQSLLLSENLSKQRKEYK